MESPVDVYEEFVYEEFVNDVIYYVVQENGEIDLTVKLSYANLYRAFKRWLKLRSIPLQSSALSRDGAERKVASQKTKRLNSKQAFPEFIRVLGRQRSHRWQGIIIVEKEPINTENTVVA